MKFRQKFLKFLILLGFSLMAAEIFLASSFSMSRCFVREKSKQSSLLARMLNLGQCCKKVPARNRNKKEKTRGTYHGVNIPTNKRVPIALTYNRHWQSLC